MNKPAQRSSGQLVEASIRDSMGFLAEVAGPNLAKGILIRRPAVVGLAERLDLDRRAVRRMQCLRARYGGGPVMLSIAGRRQAVMLSHAHLRRVLEGAPTPFAPASAEKRSALAHFEPDVSLASRGRERQVRRRLNEQVLQSHSLCHDLAETFLTVIGEEADGLMAQAGGKLDWNMFTVAWHRVVRRVVLGDGARDDHDLTDRLARLRAAGNWGFLHPGRGRLLEALHRRLETHMERREPGSLAGLIADRPRQGDSAPSHQAAHWLFAFDPAGMAAFRALALLATHAQADERARGEIAGGDRSGHLPFLRACLHESLRLWPTTPAIFRETTEDTEWPGGTMPARTSILIFAPFFHRDGELYDFADRFAPDLWLDGDPGARWPLVPFSWGPGICPARHLVPMLAGAMLADILKGRTLRLETPERLDPDRPLPGSLDNYSLRFAVEAT